MIFAILCLGLCSRAPRVHAHMEGGVDHVFIQARDAKPHIVKALGLPKDGLPFSGPGEMSFTGPPPVFPDSRLVRPGVRALVQAQVTHIDQIEIDGRMVKVKR